jgi:hypothetical protein
VENFKVEARKLESKKQKLESLILPTDSYDSENAKATSKLSVKNSIAKVGFYQKIVL